jgi:hypothetical protein
MRRDEPKKLGRRWCQQAVAKRSYRSLSFRLVFSRFRGLEACGQSDWIISYYYLKRLAQVRLRHPVDDPEGE